MVRSAGGGAQGRAAALTLSDAETSQDVVEGIVPLLSSRCFVRLVRPVVLHAAVVCGDGRALQVLHRRDRVTRGLHPEHSPACTVLGLTRGGRAEVVDDPRNAGVRVLRLHCGATDLRLVTPTGSSTERALITQLGHRPTD